MEIPLEDLDASSLVVTDSVDSLEPESDEVKLVKFYELVAKIVSLISVVIEGGSTLVYLGIGGICFLVFVS
jgi:hypothetical protein